MLPHIYILRTREENSAIFSFTTVFLKYTRNDLESPSSSNKFSHVQESSGSDTTGTSSISNDASTPPLDSANTISSSTTLSDALTPEVDHDSSNNLYTSPNDESTSYVDSGNSHEDVQGTSDNGEPVVWNDTIEDATSYVNSMVVIENDVL